MATPKLVVHSNVHLIAAQAPPQAVQIALHELSHEVIVLVKQSSAGQKQRGEQKSTTLTTTLIQKNPHKPLIYMLYGMNALPDIIVTKQKENAPAPKVQHQQKNQQKLATVTFPVQQNLKIMGQNSHCQLIPTPRYIIAIKTT